MIASFLELFSAKLEKKACLSSKSLDVSNISADVSSGKQYCST